MSDVPWAMQWDAADLLLHAQSELKQTYYGSEAAPASLMHAVGTCVLPTNTGYVVLLSNVTLCRRWPRVVQYLRYVLRGKERDTSVDASAYGLDMFTGIRQIFRLGA